MTPFRNPPDLTAAQRELLVVLIKQWAWAHEDPQLSSSMTAGEIGGRVGGYADDARSVAGRLRRLRQRGYVETTVWSNGATHYFVTRLGREAYLRSLYTDSYR